MLLSPRTALYSLALAVTVLVVAAAPVGAAPARAVTNCSPSASWGTNHTDLAAQVVDLINRYRADRGLPKLAVSAALTASSEWKSLHMAGNGYFGHDDPAPPIARSAHQRALDCGYGGGWWGENIAYGYATADAVVNGWLGSTGHRANIENPSFTSTGVGVAAAAGGRLYWTQSFGDDASAGTTPAPAPAPPPPATQPQPTAPSPAPPAVTKPPSAPAETRAVARSPSIGAMPARVTTAGGGKLLLATVRFVVTATGKPLTSGSVRCRAEIDGRRLRVLANVFAADTARCAWRIPGRAVGKTLTGVVAVQLDGTAATRLFVRRVG